MFDDSDDDHFADNDETLEQQRQIVVQQQQRLGEGSTSQPQDPDESADYQDAQEALPQYTTTESPQDTTMTTLEEIVQELQRMRGEIDTLRDDNNTLRGQVATQQTTITNQQNTIGTLQNPVQPGPIQVHIPAGGLNVQGGGGIKLQRPEVFKGDRKDAKRFMQQVRLYMLARPGDFANDDA